MKTFYCLLGLVGVLGFFPSVAGEEPKSPKVDVLAMKSLPDGRFAVKLELKQLDGVAETVELDVRDGRISAADDGGRLGRLQGRTQFIGNGVFMVQLEGKDYRATQFWVFQPDGSALIKEIPDRGENQRAVPVKRKGE